MVESLMHRVVVGHGLGGSGTTCRRIPERGLPGSPCASDLFTFGLWLSLMVHVFLQIKYLYYCFPSLALGMSIC